MIRFAICDDDRLFAERFEKIVIKEFRDKCKFSEDAECVYYENAKECLNRFNEDMIDIYFIDIEYGDIVGHDLARELEKLRSNVGIVYVTSHAQYVYKSFVCRPLGFIRKQVDYDIEVVMASVCEYLERDRRMYTFFNNTKEVLIKASDIRYITVKDHYVQVFMENTSIELRDKLSRIEKELGDNGFAKISRSCIVNMKYVSDVNDIKVTMVNKEKLCISEDRKLETFYKWKIYKMKC